MKKETREEIREAISKIARELWFSKTIALTPVTYNGTDYFILTSPPIADYAPDAKFETYEAAVKQFREAFEQNSFLGKSLWYGNGLVSLTPIESKIHLLFNIEGMVKIKEQEREKLSSGIEIKSIISLSPSIQNQDSQRTEKPPLPEGLNEEDQKELKHPLATTYLINFFLKAIQEKASKKLSSLQKSSLCYGCAADNDQNDDWNSLAPVVTKEEIAPLNDIIVQHIQDEFGIDQETAKTMVKSWPSGSSIGFHRFAIKVSGFQDKLNPKSAKPLPFLPPSLPSKENKYLPKEQKTSGEFTPFVKTLNIQVAKYPDQKNIAISLEPNFGASGNLPEIHIILVIDSSSSMRSIFNKIQKEINNFLNQLATNPNKDSIKISLITFNKDADTVFTNRQINTNENLNELKSLTDRIRTQTGTDICAGLKKAIALCTKKNNRLIFITDGEQFTDKDNFKTNLEEIFSGLNLERIPYVGIIGFSPNVSLENLKLLREVFENRTETTLPFDYTKEPDGLSALLNKHCQLALLPVLPPSSIRLKFSEQKEGMSVSDIKENSITSFLIGAEAKTITFIFRQCSTFELELSIMTKEGSQLVIKNIDSNINHKISSGNVILTGEAKQLKYEENSSMDYFVREFTLLDTEYSEGKIDAGTFQRLLIKLNQDIETVSKDLQSRLYKSGSELSKFQQGVVKSRIEQIRQEISRKTLGILSVSTEAQRHQQVSYVSAVSQNSAKYVHKK